MNCHGQCSSMSLDCVYLYQVYVRLAMCKTTLFPQVSSPMLAGQRPDTSLFAVVWSCSRAEHSLIGPLSPAPGSHSWPYHCGPCHDTLSPHLNNDHHSYPSRRAATGAARKGKKNEGVRLLTFYLSKVNHLVTLMAIQMFVWHSHRSFDLFCGTQKKIFCWMFAVLFSIQ